MLCYHLKNGLDRLGKIFPDRNFTFPFSDNVQLSASQLGGAIPEGHAVAGGGGGGQLHALHGGVHGAEAGGGPGGQFPVRAGGSQQDQGPLRDHRPAGQPPLRGHGGGVRARDWRPDPHGEQLYLLSLDRHCGACEVPGLYDNRWRRQRRGGGLLDGPRPVQGRAAQEHGEDGESRYLPPVDAGPQRTVHGHPAHGSGKKIEEIFCWKIEKLFYTETF